MWFWARGHGVNKYDGYMLNQSYPNPFNPETQLTYELAEKSKVVLNSYNLVGQKIKTLVNSTEGTGIQKVYLGWKK